MEVDLYDYVESTLWDNWTRNVGAITQEIKLVPVDHGFEEHLKMGWRFTYRHPELKKTKIQVFILIRRQVRRKEQAKAKNAKKCASFPAKWRVPFERRDKRPAQPRIVYLPILDINNFHHFLDILENYNPIDDEPMWAADCVVAPTLGSTITIPETANELAIKGCSCLVSVVLIVKDC
ncbi:hypothetical protein Tco_0672186 [Tanacetum coccineum]